MENKINLVEILRHCPQGMELDSTMYEDVYFDYVDELNIIHCYIQYETFKTSLTFNQHGTPNGNIKSKCVIFPKGKTTWEDFVPPIKFEDGDIVYFMNKYGDEYISIVKNIEGNYLNTYIYSGASIWFSKFSFHIYNIRGPRLATEEEKQKLFAVIKANGYHWNKKTKTLEKLVESKFKIGDKIKLKKHPDIICTVTKINEDGSISVNDYNLVIKYELQDRFELVPDEIKPKFKVGDRVKRKNVNYTHIVTISKINEEYYSCVKEDGQYSNIYIKTAQDNWELVPNEIEPKFKVGDRIKTNEYEYIIVEIKDGYYLTECGNKIHIKNQDYFKLVPNKFDISTLVPFESRVLVRDHESQIWKPAIFGGYIDGYREQYKYAVVGGSFYKYLIPYKGNEHLRCKIDDCDKYYKVW